eukprot:2305551-Amphidinium_carterae.1
MLQVCSVALHPKEAARVRPVLRKLRFCFPPGGKNKGKKCPYQLLANELPHKGAGKPCALLFGLSVGRSVWLFVDVLVSYGHDHKIAELRP